MRPEKMPSSSEAKKHQLINPNERLSAKDALDLQNYIQSLEKAGKLPKLPETPKAPKNHEAPKSPAEKAFEARKKFLAEKLSVIDANIESAKNTLNYATQETSTRTFIDGKPATPFSKEEVTRAEDNLLGWKMKRESVSDAIQALEKGESEPADLKQVLDSLEVKRRS